MDEEVLSVLASATLQREEEEAAQAKIDDHDIAEHIPTVKPRCSGCGTELRDKDAGSGLDDNVPDMTCPDCGYMTCLGCTVMRRQGNLVASPRLYPAELPDLFQERAIAQILTLVNHTAILLHAGSTASTFRMIWKHRRRMMKSLSNGTVVIVIQRSLTYYPSALRIRSGLAGTARRRRNV
jgi:predicted RNA-binding Zn-ribbon protein involved in translation (DUF1610 family)